MEQLMGTNETDIFLHFYTYSKIQFAWTSERDSQSVSHLNNDRSHK